MSEIAASTPPNLTLHITRLEQALDNIVSFWFPHCIDERHGGYQLNAGTEGQDLGPASPQ